VQLIKKGVAYVCDLTPEQTYQYRGSPDRPGKDSPWRNRSVEESLDLFCAHKKGEFPTAPATLRSKIDMASPNIWFARSPSLPHPPCRTPSHRSKWSSTRSTISPMPE